jgi:Icc-related predicted phosphoesterase
MGEWYRMVRIAAVADVHCHRQMHGQLADALKDVNERADVLVIAGDLTATGKLVEAEEFIKEVAHVSIPIVTVLGNHDYESDEQTDIRDLLEKHGIHVLDGNAVNLDTPGGRVGLAGAKGFAGGFDRYLLTAFGEQVVKDFVLAGLVEVGKLERAMSMLDAPHRVVVLHYSPVADTLVGEPLQLHSFLGNSELGVPIDRLGADVVFHGHGHYGSQYGMSKTGIPVFNVAQALVVTYYLHELPSRGESVPASTGTAREGQSGALAPTEPGSWAS